MILNLVIGLAAATYLIVSFARLCIQFGSVRKAVAYQINSHTLETDLLELLSYDVVLFNQIDVVVPEYRDVTGLETWCFRRHGGREKRQTPFAYLALINQLLKQWDGYQYGLRWRFSLDLDNLTYTLSCADGSAAKTDSLPLTDHELMLLAELNPN